jgi:uncharacterized protein YkwD
MVLGLNAVDLVIISVLLIFAFDGVGRSLVIETLDLISFLLAMLISFSFYNFPARFFEGQFNTPHGLSLVLGFMVSWFLTESLFYIFVRFFISKLPHFKIVFEKYLSIIPAILRGLIFIALILVVIATFPVQPKLKKSVQDSKVGNAILNNAYALEQPMKNVFGGFSDETLTFLTIKPKTNENINLGFKTSDFKIDERAEFDMLDLVNKERTIRGLNALKYDPILQKAARDHSADMFQRGYFSHYTPEGEDVANRGDKYSVEYIVIGENLAYAPTLETAHQGLMNSPGHRANILSAEFNKIGVGVMNGDAFGMMFTQVFSD